MADRLPHVFTTPTHCAHCGCRDVDDDADGECPVRLRAEIDRLTRERDEAQAVVAGAADRILWPGSLDPAEHWWLEAAAPHIAAHKARTATP